ncbi:MULTISPECIES: CHC2 zinc finger domain-containing protein [Chryseobacterium]|uniref:DNA primase n=2 Tax=Chryseobacterium taihuense TaxID=1141221 RepID=A0A4U8WPD8_9FLAO|nr:MULTISPECIES: CHC2 zinc finger domain-containing protein [Chryseobacterium]QQV02460.1 toprim domain-containing protein [Chryseobacterium sp. FDAARGOS 1104]QQV02466.1 toprim domain-containing protein [Chryseobacterium sp. FDAARGOS 1104]QQV02472.1 toprim domain-containing protein [Chryseobacterium sp. FDAARGOS 1104]QQV02478.1 toprim domain-containing protein [Chryseobacterium sp. FDAARGOS 1104]VFB04279.1 DNA primase [Chryseobacterium taihuense]
MEISAIKERLSLSEVLKHYNLQPKNNMLKCFMHEDKTASLQVNLEKNFYKCHSCGETGDVIQFIEDYEKISKHEAIKKAESLISSETKNIQRGSGNLGQTKISSEKSALFLEKVYLSFRKGIFNSVPAKEYAKKRALQVEELEIGFNSGQLHYAERRGGEKGLIPNLLDVGLLSLAGTNSRTGGQAYKTFGIKSIVFPLKNKENQIVSFYFRSIVNDKEAKHFYLKNRSGIYPNYPKSDTKKLILTEAIIDCASLLQIKEIRDNYSLISCFGTNGLNEEILKAIKELKNLEEIIFCFDQDKAGKTAVEKYSDLIMNEFENLKITSVELPNNDVNETLQLHDESIFKDLLENRKDIFLSTEKIKVTVEKSAESAQSAREPRAEPKTIIEFLEQKSLLKSLNQLIEKAGIIGEENSRLLLFLITISYFNKSPLHGIVQGSSGSGKTHIISRIADLMPQEDVLRFTRITESSLYNWGEFDLFQKIIIIEDLDGLKEDALYALREFISNQVLRSSVTIKDKKGNNKSSHKIVKGQFSSLSATTKGETYEDNMNRSFIIAINESEEQTRKIIDYQNLKNAGMIDRNNEQKAISFIQRLVKNLKCYEVVNPYAMELQLPDKVKNKRRLNEMVQSIIKQITILNQYQRKQTSDGKLITEIEDLQQGIEILFESIILKIDELDGSLRQFLEKLKKRFDGREFNRFEAMEYTGFKKSQLQVYLNELVRLEYLKQKGFVNKGFTYKIGYSDDIGKVRQELKEHFKKIIDKLKSEASGS